MTSRRGQVRGARYERASSGSQGVPRGLDSHAYWQTPDMHADWGADEAYRRDSWPSEPLPPERLPAVVAARTDGWCMAPDAPLWSFLPAVWPAAARAWVPDLSVRLTRLQCDGGVDAIIPWSAWDHAETERDTDDMLVEAGIPARPFGRLWLLKPPPPFEDLDAAVDANTATAQADGVPLMCCTEVVTWTHAVVARWFADSA